MFYFSDDSIEKVDLKNNYKNENNFAEILLPYYIFKHLENIEDTNIGKVENMILENIGPLLSNDEFNKLQQNDSYNFKYVFLLGALANSQYSLMNESEFFAENFEFWIGNIDIERNQNIYWNVLNDYFLNVLPVLEIKKYNEDASNTELKNYIDDSTGSFNKYNLSSNDLIFTAPINEPKIPIESKNYILNLLSSSISSWVYGDKNNPLNYTKVIELNFGSLERVLDVEKITNLISPIYLDFFHILKPEHEPPAVYKKSFGEIDEKLRENTFVKSESISTVEVENTVNNMVIKHNRNFNNDVIVSEYATKEKLNSIKRSIETMFNYIDYVTNSTKTDGIYFYWKGLTVYENKNNWLNSERPNVGGLTIYTSEYSLVLGNDNIINDSLNSYNQIPFGTFFHEFGHVFSNFLSKNVGWYNNKEKIDMEKVNNKNKTYFGKKINENQYEWEENNKNKLINLSNIKTQNLSIDNLDYRNMYIQINNHIKDQFDTMNNGANIVIPDWSRNIKSQVIFSFNNKNIFDQMNQIERFLKATGVVEIKMTGIKEFGNFINENKFNLIYKKDAHNISNIKQDMLEIKINRQSASDSLNTIKQNLIQKIYVPDISESDIELFKDTTIYKSETVDEKYLSDLFENMKSNHQFFLRVESSKESNKVYGSFYQKIDLLTETVGIKKVSTPIWIIICSISIPIIFIGIIIFVYKHRKKQR